MIEKEWLLLCLCCLEQHGGALYVKGPGFAWDHCMFAVYMHAACTYECRLFNICGLCV